MSGRHAYEENEDRDDHCFAEEVNPPAVERLDDQGDDGVEDGDVPRVQEGLVQPFHVAEAIDEPVERVSGDHDCLQDVEQG